MSGRRCLTVSHLIWPRQLGDVSWSVSDSQLSGLRPLPGPGQVSSNNTRNQSLASRGEWAQWAGGDKPSPPTLMTDAQMPAPAISQSHNPPSYIFSPPASPNKETPGDGRAELADNADADPSPLAMITPKLPSTAQAGICTLHWLVVAKKSDTHNFLTYFNWVDSRYTNVLHSEQEV